MLGVPLIRDGTLIGVMGFARAVVKSFNAKEIELATTFANQAIIAIENARLLTELRQRTADLTESLEQQTATSEVLQVISSSPGDLQPVFAAMLEKAVGICDAKFGNIYRWDGEALHVIATHNTPQAFVEGLRRVPYRPNPKAPIGQMVATKTVVHVTDVMADTAYIEQTDPMALAAVALGHTRTALAVPLLNEGEVIGAFVLSRQEVRPFTDRQIALVTNFAAQAVIAIENARLLTQLHESLQEQTATSQVLEVISSFPGDLQPVFATMLEKAVRICEAEFGVLFRYDDAGFEPATLSNAPPAYANFVWSRGQFFPQTGNGLDRLLRTKTVIHSVDEAAEPVATNSARLAGARSQVLVPMLKEGKLAGAIAIYRQEVRPFSDKQIESVKNFAAQAVIAIENARLLNELRQRTTDLTESLEQQTATSEVLQVISSSLGELEPVFASMLEKALRICKAKFGMLYRHESGRLRLMAARDVPPMFAAARKGPFTPAPGGMLDSVIKTGRTVHLPDLAATQAYLERHPIVVEAVEHASLGGVRTVVGVPMIHENELVGIIGIYRQCVRPFTEKKIALLTSFATQASIAIENARLLNELRESLQEQTATSEVLQVISSSPGDVQPVFSTVLENAVRICEAKFGLLYLYERGKLRLAAARDVPPAFAKAQGAGPFDPVPGGVLDAVLKTGRTVHLPDLAATQGYLERHSRTVAGVELGGIRTVVAVPMLSVRPDSS
jgi:GAF domain-containing protein